MELVNQQYQVQGVLLSELCRQYGTPLFVYDGAKILSQYERLTKAFSGTRVRIKYAAKALTNQSILKLLREAGCGIDVVSIEELHLALKAGFSKSSIMFTPNCSDYSELQEAVKAGVTVNVDNLPFLELFGKEFGGSYPLCIRINPHIVAGGNEKIQTGHKESKFGISKEQEQDIHRIVGQYGIKVIGMHVHSGSDFKDSDAFVKAAEIVFGIARHFSGLQFLDMGSGFKVAYKEGDIVTDVEDLGRKMTDAFNKFCASYGRDLELWFEPGKFLVSESGLLLVETTVVKETPALTFVGVNSGLNHIIRPMMYGSYHGVQNISNPTGSEKEYNVVGYICETDTFGSNLRLNEVRRGDLLAIRNAGAYCFSMSSNYNSRLRPAEILVHKGKPFLIRKRETFEDLLRLQVENEW